MDEHVKFFFGADTSMLNRALRAINNDVRNMAEKTTSSLKGMGQSLRGGLLAGGLLNIFSLVDSVTDAVDNFVKRSKEVGQFWGAFSVGGADAVRQIQDVNAEAEKAGEKAKKLRKERKEREEASKDLDQTARDIRIDEAEGVDKIKLLEAERLRLLKEFLNTQDNTIEKIKKQEELIKAESKLRQEMSEQQKKAAEEREKAEKKAADQLEKQDEIIKRLHHAEDDHIKSTEELQISREDRSKFTLEQLANLNARSVSGNLRREVFTARDIQELEKQGTRLRDRGFFHESQERFNKADELRKGMIDLVDRERFPFKSQEENIKKTAEKLEELVEKAENEGIKIIPSNGA